jgi:hypothetical protein
MPLDDRQQCEGNNPCLRILFAAITRATRTVTAITARVAAPTCRLDDHHVGLTNVLLPPSINCRRWLLPERLMVSYGVSKTNGNRECDDGMLVSTHCELPKNKQPTDNAAGPG